MELLERLNSAVEYVEDNLCGDVDVRRAAKIAVNSADGFQRLFRCLTGVTLTEYIRRRRLSLAACELQNAGGKVMDIAVKYGYDSADAFCRAFVKQHGVTPSRARVPGTALKIYPPLSFHILIKGAKEMDFRRIETGDIALRGIRKPFAGNPAGRFEQEHEMWAAEHDDAPGRISDSVPGAWYGIWDGGTYWVARKPEDVTAGGLDETVIPGGSYAVFTTGRGGFAGYELPKLRALVFDAWLDRSGYRQTRDYEVEVYHLCTRQGRNNRYYELWIPVAAKDAP